MATPYKVTVYRGTTAAAFVATPFQYAGNTVKSIFIQYNVWDALALIQWLLNDGSYTGDIKLDNNWQPIIIPSLALGFQIKDETAGVHAEYQIVSYA